MIFWTSCLDAARNFVGIFLKISVLTKTIAPFNTGIVVVFVYYILSISITKSLYLGSFSSVIMENFCLCGRTCQGEDKFLPFSIISADLNFLIILDHPCPRHLLPLIILIYYYRDFNFKIKVNEDFFFLRNILKDIIFCSSCMDNFCVIVTRLFDSFWGGGCE